MAEGGFLSAAQGEPDEWTHTCTQNDHIEFPTESQYVSMTMSPPKNANKSRLVRIRAERMETWERDGIRDDPKFGSSSPDQTESEKTWN